MNRCRFLKAVFEKLIWIQQEVKLFELLVRGMCLKQHICRLAHKHTHNCANVYKQFASLGFSFHLIMSREKYHCTNNIALVTSFTYSTLCEFTAFLCKWLCQSLMKVRSLFGLY